MVISPLGRLQHRSVKTAGALVALFLLLTVSTIPATSKAEIPHENYDIANPDLATVVNLLNTSIRASEETLKEFYNRTMDEADAHLQMVDSILVPARQVLSKIEYVAGSYQNLNALLPPFLDLRTGMESFSVMERSMLDARARLLSLRDLGNLSDEDLVAALDTIRTVNALISGMNRTIDEMLLSAQEINGLVVEGTTPFVPNSLIPLIEKLRDMLGAVLEEIEPIIHNDIPWGPDRAFLVLWVEETSLYLGDRIVGGGYLFYNGSFRGHHLIHILWDGGEITSTATNANGTYEFTMRLSLNVALLGNHTLMSTAMTSNGTLSSDEIGIEVLLMPTTLSLDIDKPEISINETVTAKLTLIDVRGDPIPDATCTLDYAGESSSATTDAKGQITRSYKGDELGFGIHEFEASYPAELPYLSSYAGPVNVTVSIPTRIELELFSERFVPGYYIVGKGGLRANASQTLPAQTLAIYIDDRFILNTTTDSVGEFALSVSSTDLAGGAHTIRIAFDRHGVVWRYSEVEQTFLITKMRKGDYPFFPFFPGWDKMPPDQIVYLFFGPYAYYVWLLMLMVLVVAVKTVQMSKSRMAARKSSVIKLIAEPHPEASAVPIFTDSMPDWTSVPEGPIDPNSRIVWLYNMLIEFLRRKRKITITDDMTHWEVARLLKKLGYPKESVERVTVLFERAFYSGSELTDVDSVGMSTAMDGIRRGGVSDAQ